MFTGIVRSIGRVRDVATAGAALELEIDADGLAQGMPGEGGSIAVAGVCLTVIRVHAGQFAAHVSAETIACTTLGALRAGDPVNLEPALTAGDPLGGHWVTGHVDSVARIAEIVETSGSAVLTIEAPAACARYLAPKGSVTLDGVSLTVNAVEGRRFTVNLVPHTRRATTLGAARPGQTVNLEADILARYVARLLESGSGHAFD